MNVELFVTIVLILLVYHSVCKIILGAVHAEKSQYYDWTTVIDGLLGLGIACVVWFG